MFGRCGIEVAEQAGEAIELLLLTPGTARGGDLGQALMHLHHRWRLPVRGRRQPLRGDAEVASLAVQLDDLLLGSAVGGRDRGHQQSLAQAYFNRLEKRHESALDEVGDRLELVGRRGPVHVGEDANQLVPAARRLHQVQVRRQLSELHDYLDSIIVLTWPRLPGHAADRSPTGINHPGERLKRHGPTLGPFDRNELDAWNESRAGQDPGRHGLLGDTPGLRPRSDFLWWALPPGLSSLGSPRSRTRGCSTAIESHGEGNYESGHQAERRSVQSAR